MRKKKYSVRGGAWVHVFMPSPQALLSFSFFLKNFLLVYFLFCYQRDSSSRRRRRRRRRRSSVREKGETHPLQDDALTHSFPSPSGASLFLSFYRRVCVCVGLFISFFFLPLLLLILLHFSLFSALNQYVAQCTLPLLLRRRRRRRLRHCGVGLVSHRNF